MTMTSALAQNPTDVLNEIRLIRRAAQYQASPAAELDRAEAAFAVLLGQDDSDANLAASAAKWSGEGFALDRVVVDDTAYWWLREKPDARRGRGAFLFRKTRGLALQFQIPHGDSDLGTDAIGVSLCFENRAQLCVFNTVHRDSLDLAHAADSYMMRLTKAESHAHPDAFVVQLHGFEGGRRKTRDAKQTDCIFSTTEAATGPAIRPAVDRFTADNPGVVARVFGSDVFELGGTTNVEGTYLRGLGPGKFLHLEMSKPVRDRLQVQTTFRQSLYETFLRIANFEPWTNPTAHKR